MTPEIAAAIDIRAKRHGLESAAIQAVAWVESAGTFFWTVNGKQMPPIRPEVHKFYAFLEGAKRDEAVKQRLAHPNRNGVPLPNTWSGLYDFFERMRAIDEDAAIKATSWGIGQVMGFNYDVLKLPNAKAVMDLACSGLDGQLDLMCDFIEASPNLVAALKARNWAQFAEGYNGSAYKTNRYDTKLKEAYAEFSKNPVDGGVYLVQQKLKALGLYTGTVDGWKGPKTTDAVKAFQQAAGLTVDGDVGKITVDEIDSYVAAKKSQTARKVIPTVAAAGAGVTTVAQPISDAIVNGDLAHAIEKTQTIAGGISSILALIKLPAIVTGVILAVVIAFVLYKLLTRVGDDHKATILKDAGK